MSRTYRQMVDNKNNKAQSTSGLVLASTVLLLLLLLLVPSPPLTNKNMSCTWGSPSA